MEDNRVFIGCQCVVLDSCGVSVDVDLYRNDDGTYELNVDSSNWEYDYRDFMKKYYPKENAEYLIRDVTRECYDISHSVYYTIEEVNNTLSQHCCYGDYYDFEDYDYE